MPCAHGHRLSRKRQRKERKRKMQRKERQRKRPTLEFLRSFLKGKSTGKGKAQAKGKGKDFGSSSAVCWTCGRKGHFSNKCPLNRVSAAEETEEEEQFCVDEEGVWDHSWEDWTVGALSDGWSLFGKGWDSWDDVSWEWWPSSDFGWSEWLQETWQAPQEAFPFTTQETPKKATLPKQLRFRL